jgi:hypothetical protein
VKLQAPAWSGLFVPRTVPLTGKPDVCDAKKTFLADKNRVHAELMRLARAGQITYYSALGAAVGKHARWPLWPIVLERISDNELAKGEPAGRGVASLLRLGPVPRNGTPAFRFLVRLLGCSRGLLAGFSEASAARLAGLQPPPSKAQGNLEDYDAPLIDD